MCNARAPRLPAAAEGQLYARQSGRVGKKHHSHSLEHGARSQRSRTLSHRTPLRRTRQFDVRASALQSPVANLCVGGLLVHVEWPAGRMHASKSVAPFGGFPFLIRRAEELEGCPVRDEGVLSGEMAKRQDAPGKAERGNGTCGMNSGCIGQPVYHQLKARTKLLRNRS
jgi:hypothetical protein